MGQISSTCTPTTTLPDKIFLKHCGPLNMKSTGNSKNIGLHYAFDSNVGPHLSYRRQIVQKRQLWSIFQVSHCMVNRTTHVDVHKHYNNCRRPVNSMQAHSQLPVAADSCVTQTILAEQLLENSWQHPVKVYDHCPANTKHYCVNYSVNYWNT